MIPVLVIITPASRHSRALRPLNIVFLEHYKYTKGPIDSTAGRKWGRISERARRTNLIYYEKMRGFLAKVLAKAVSLIEGICQIAIKNLTMNELTEFMGILPHNNQDYDWQTPKSAKSLEHSYLLYQMNRLARHPDGSEPNETRLWLTDFLHMIMHPIQFSTFKDLHLGLRTPLSGTTPDGTFALSGITDYTMFYRDHSGRESPLVPIVVKQQRDLSKGIPQLLGYMLVVSGKIKEKEGATKPVYGLLSDGNQFEFYRLDEELRYCVEILQWGQGPQQQQEIAYLLYHILNDHSFNDAAPMPPPCPLDRMFAAASSGDAYSLTKLSRLGRRRVEEDSMEEA